MWLYEIEAIQSHSHLPRIVSNICAMKQHTGEKTIQDNVSKRKCVLENTFLGRKATTLTVMIAADLKTSKFVPNDK